MQAKDIPEDKKLAILSEIKNQIPLKELVTKHGVSYPILLRWRKELNNAVDKNDILGLIDVDKVIVQSIATKVEEDLQELAATEEGIVTTTAVTIAGEIDNSLAKIDTYQLLNAQTQLVATKVLSHIDEIIQELPTDATAISAIESLTNSIAKLHLAFFSKPGSTSVNVLNQTNISDRTVSSFKEALKL